MYFVYEIPRVTAIETFLASLPDAVGMLVFGIGLVVAAVLTRSLLARLGQDKKDEKDTKKA